MNSLPRTALRTDLVTKVDTHCELHYEGSCGIDENLLKASNIRPNVWGDFLLLQLRVLPPRLETASLC